jgi:hypothetical protein
MTDAVKIESQDYWFKVVDMLQQNRALIDAGETHAVFFFVSDASGVFDQLAFASIETAKASLAENDFRRFEDDPQARSFLTPPQPPFFNHPHPNGPIYSSGRFWKVRPDL